MLGSLLAREQETIDSSSLSSSPAPVESKNRRRRTCAPQAAISSDTNIVGSGACPRAMAKGAAGAGAPLSKRLQFAASPQPVTY